MKNLNLNIFVLLFFALITALLSDLYAAETETYKIAKEKTVLFKLDGMGCSEDAEIIQNKLKEIEGIKECKVSFVKKQIKVTYDNSKISKNKLIEFIEALPDCEGRGTTPYKLREI